jgi:hypothetical protein
MKEKSTENISPTCCFCCPSDMNILSKRIPSQKKQTTLQTQILYDAKTEHNSNAHKIWIYMYR